MQLGIMTIGRQRRHMSGIFERKLIVNWEIQFKIADFKP
jgi:hypothetical protein